MSSVSALQLHPDNMKVIMEGLDIESRVLTIKTADRILVVVP